ncbi:TPA: hypothetical protein H2W70_004116 [Salmonella enterica]|nr:hypothetical protein [Salmonella enterica]HAK8195217.1 hypothetical protein [Salmonella enterica]HAK8434565.1 hypothetical protein [Salmonella enterica]HAK8462313.1 hypothetical protein [Salmonella enterica]
MFNLDGSTLASYLGCSYRDSGLIGFLEQASIFDAPFVPQDDEFFFDEPDIAWERSRESRMVEVERYSICLIYEDSECYNLLYNEKMVDPFVLKEIVFYGKDVQGYKGYKGNLPCGVLFSDFRYDIRNRKNFKYITTRILEGLEVDLLYVDGFIVNISFSSSDEIESFHIRSPHIYDLEMLGIHKVIGVTEKNYPDVTKLINFLGKNQFDKELMRCMSLFSLYNDDNIITNCNHTQSFDFYVDYGLMLHFDCAANFSNVQRDKNESGVIFSGIQVVRKGEFLSKGYNGENLYDIKFSFLKDDIIKAIGREPDGIKNINIYTVLVWKEESCILHVLLNLLDCQVEQISYFSSFMEKHFDYLLG